MDVHQQHCPDYSAQHENVAEYQDARCEEFLELDDVILHTGHDASHFVLVIEVQGKALQMPEQVHPEVVQYVLAYPGHENELDVVKCPSDQCVDAHGNQDPRQAVQVSVYHRPECHGDQPGEQYQASRVHQHRNRGNGYHLLVRPQIREQPGHHLLVVQAAADVRLVDVA